jgi:two-component system, OmpR family, sensor histidine kinase MprB
MSLRVRIALVAGGAVAVAVLGVAVTVYFAVRSELRAEVDNALEARAAALAGPGPGPPPGAPRDGGRPRFRPGPEFAPPPGPGARFGGAEGYVQLVSSGGRAFRPPGESSSLPVEPRTRSIARTGSGRYVTDVHVRGTHLRVLTSGIGPRGAVQVARPLNEVDHALRRVLVILVLAVAGGIGLAAALGAAVARAALAPIARFTGRTEALSESLDLSQRLDVPGKDELARLAHSFNTTLDALERAVEAQRHLVADASHELRTPIASLRANIQVLEDAERLPAEERESLRADILEELDELTALVGDVVELARGAQPEESLDDVRLDRVVEELVERARRRAGDGTAFLVRTEPTVIRGAPERISRAVSNLLDNARRWSPSSGSIEVDLDGGVLTVRDHGPGFAEEDLPHVFERFFRAKDARGMPGSGLGLSIVRQAAEAHGGWVEAANASDGGAVLRVRFGPSIPPQGSAPDEVPAGATEPGGP